MLPHSPITTFTFARITVFVCYILRNRLTLCLIALTLYRNKVVKAVEKSIAARTFQKFNVDLKTQKRPDPRVPACDVFHSLQLKSAACASSPFGRPSRSVPLGLSRAPTTACSAGGPPTCGHGEPKIVSRTRGDCELFDYFFGCNGCTE